MFNMFAGGALSAHVSIFAHERHALHHRLHHHPDGVHGVSAVDAQIRKDGESGRRKTDAIHAVRHGVPGADSRASARRWQCRIQAAIWSSNPGPQWLFIATVTIDTGTMFVMWLGEQITERGIGNGITMIIVAGIVAGLPRAIGTTLEMVRSGEMNPLVRHAA